MTYQAENIKVLKGLEPVRKRPGMYIGGVGSEGLHHLIWEILDNSIDEYLAGYGDTIYLHLDTEENRMTIRDYGRGIPVNKIASEKKSALRVILSTLHAGGKFDTNSYKISGGLHGVGSSVVNALSESFKVTVCRDKNMYIDEYKRAVPIVELINGDIPIAGECRVKDTGTEISFVPDKEIFKDIKFKREIIEKKLTEISFLNKGLKLIFSVDDEEEQCFYEDSGIIGLLNAYTDDYENVVDNIYLHTQEEDIDIELVFKYNDSGSESIYSFVNNINTSDGGTHETAFKSAYTRVLNQYIKELNKKSFTGSELREGLACIVNIKISEPIFVGQTKSKFEMPDKLSVMSNIISTMLIYYFDRNKDVLNDILRYAKENKENKKIVDKSKKTKTKKLLAEGNGKLAAATSRKYRERELFIVEGDSAGGSAKQARDRKTQAVLPLRGKVLNVEKVGIMKALKNTEIATILSVLGTGFLKDYDEDKLKYDKIIIMTDADVDGAHIMSLLITMFFNLTPKLIENGHLYVAEPPLYKVGDTYCYSDEELKECMKKNKGPISRFKGLGEMNPSQLKKTTMDKNTRKVKQIKLEDLEKAKSLTNDLMGKNTKMRKQILFDSVNVG